MEHNFWIRLGGIIILISLFACFLMGAVRLGWIWVLFLIPSYLLGYYLYRIAGNEKNRIEFKYKIHFFIIAGIVTLSIIYIIGVIFNIIGTYI